MMPTDRFERQLPELLTELANPRTPDYLDDLLWQTANTSQRPAWSFLERWLPMVDIARQPVLAPRMPWRSIGLAFVLLALLIATLTAIAVGTRPNPPAPFGPARTGLVAYSDGGDIFTVDAANGTVRTIVSGPETDVNPQWSLDGTRLVFQRFTEGDRGRSFVYTTTSDGSALTRITPTALPEIGRYAFSPDGAEIAIAASLDGSILIAAADGSGVRRLDIPHLALDPAWRPTDGAEILFTGGGGGAPGDGTIYAVNPSSGEVRTILASETGRARYHPLWSPDGSEIAYVETDAAAPDPTTAQIHIMSADGTHDRLLPIPPGVALEAALAWSNDGSRLLAVRGSAVNAESWYVVIPADGSGSAVEVTGPRPVGWCCAWSSWQWAPDDSLILGMPEDADGQPMPQVIIDPVAGTSTTAPWNGSSHATWQRLAP
jgi:Tol biopolymer transport system component